MHQISITEAKQKFSQIVQAVLSGREVIITENDEPIIKMISLKKNVSKPKFGSAKGLIEIADDFDEPITLQTSNF